jgi:hypothetical protein
MDLPAPQVEQHWFPVGSLSSSKPTCAISRWPGSTTSSPVVIEKHFTSPCGSPSTTTVFVEPVRVFVRFRPCLLGLGLQANQPMVRRLDDQAFVRVTIIDTSGISAGPSGVMVIRCHESSTGEQTGARWVLSGQYRQATTRAAPAAKIAPRPQRASAGGLVRVAESSYSPRRLADAQ